MKKRKPDPRKIYATDAERQTARRVRRYASGLNSQGKPYQRHPNFVNHADSAHLGEMQREQRRQRLQKHLARYQRIAAENRAQGLRVDGEPFRRRVGLRAWQRLRAGMVIGPVSFGDLRTDTTKRW